MTKQLLIITFILLAMGGCSSTIENMDRMGENIRIDDAAMGCNLTYAQAKALDEDEARLCRKKKLEANRKERERNNAISKGAKVNP